MPDDRRGRLDRTRSADKRLVGRRIRELRRARGLTQGALAKAACVSRSAVAQWETGRVHCGRNIVRVATALRTPPETLELPGRGPPALDRGDDVALAVDEDVFLQALRQLDDGDRQCVMRIAIRLANQSASPLSARRQRRGPPGIAPRAPDVLPGGGKVTAAPTAVVSRATI